MHLNKPAGVILAGGRSSRMGAARKALARIDGQTLLAHVIGRLQPQVDPLLLSCEGHTTAFEAYGLPLVADLLQGYRGPLTGLYSALQYLQDKGRNNGLVLCPCDAPFIPVNLVEVMLDALQGDTTAAVVISWHGELQPTFSMWQSHHLDVIHDMVVNQGKGGLKTVLNSISHRVVEWAPEEPSPFFNVNTPEDLEVAQMWLDHA